MASLDSALKKWAEFWDTLIDLSDSDRERLYTTMAAEINACSNHYVVHHRNVGAAS